MDKNQKRTIITVMGVGGGGNNAVNYMYLQDIEDVTYVVSDTDRHQLEDSPVPNRVLLGMNTTHGHNASDDPDVARRAAEESEHDIAALFDDAHHVGQNREYNIYTGYLLGEKVFITAGMGGGTGTGAAPVVARIAHEKGVLTVGLVTIPFLFEGTESILKALAGVEEMRKNVDALFIIDNERLTELYSDLNSSNAFTKVDETLTTVFSSLYGLITPVNPRVCLDFHDIKYTLHKGGNAFIVSGFGSGERRVTKAIVEALKSPLLKNHDVYSSRKFLIYIYFNPDSVSLHMDELNEIEEFTANFDQEVDFLWSIDHDNSLEDQVKVTILSTGLKVSVPQPSRLKHENPMP